MTQRYHMMETKKRIGMLIDCDNASPYAIKGILKELSKNGEVIIKNAYGNWNNNHLNGWASKLLDHTIKPIQQFDYTKGKNATDIAMVIDAMDLMYTKNLDGFALITSDSDFTPLAMRLMSNGISVYGFGEKKTPQAFINACSQFIFTENLEKEVNTSKRPLKVTASTPEQVKTLLEDESLMEYITDAIHATSDENGFSFISAVGIYLSNNSSFSFVNYGYNNLSALIKDIPFCETMKEENSPQYKVRLKNQDTSQTTTLKDEGKINAVLDDYEFMDWLYAGLKTSSDDDGWINTAQLGIYLSNNFSFSPVNYGYQKLGGLLRDIPFLETKMENNNTILFVREK